MATTRTTAAKTSAATPATNPDEQPEQFDKDRAEDSATRLDTADDATGAGSTGVRTNVTGTDSPAEGSAMASAQNMLANQYSNDSVAGGASDTVTRTEAAELLGVTPRQVDRYREDGVLTELEPTDQERERLETNPRTRVSVRFHRAQVAAVRAALRKAASERVPTQELTTFLKRYAVIDGVPVPQGTAASGGPIAPILADSGRDASGAAGLATEDDDEQEDDTEDDDSEK